MIPLPLESEQYPLTPTLVLTSADSLMSSRSEARADLKLYDPHEDPQTSLVSHSRQSLNSSAAVVIWNSFDIP